MLYHRGHPPFILQLGASAGTVNIPPEAMQALNVCIFVVGFMIDPSAGAGASLKNLEFSVEELLLPGLRRIKTKNSVNLYSIVPILPFVCLFVLFFIKAIVSIFPTPRSALRSHERAHGPPAMPKDVKLHGVPSQLLCGTPLAALANRYPRAVIQRHRTELKRRLSSRRVLWSPDREGAAVRQARTAREQRRVSAGGA